VSSIEWAASEIETLGSVPDLTVAQRKGVSLATVRRKRRELNIDAYVRPTKPTAKPSSESSRKGRPNTIEWHQDDLNALLEMPDKTLARRMGISATTVRYKRLERERELGIPSVNRSAGNYVSPDAWTHEQIALLGTMPDPEVAKKTGKGLKTVQTARYARGIAQFKHPEIRNPVRSAADFKPLPWKTLANMAPQDFYQALALEYQRVIGVPLTFETLALLSHWNIAALRAWFAPGAKGVEVSLQTRHHLWLVIKSTGWKDIILSK
jgi:hypothetical protein